MGPSAAKLLVRRLLDGLRQRLAQEATSDDLGAAAVLFAPHPDDETLGVGGTVIQKIGAGARVTLVFMTDGSRSHRHLMPAGELRELRAREAREAALALGVCAEDVLFLGIEDGELAAESRAAVSRVAAILRERGPRQILLPYRLETPPDHRATYEIVLSALGETDLEPVLLEYPIWFWAHWPWAQPETRCRSELLGEWKNSLVSWIRFVRDFRFDVDISAVLDRKRAALEKHRSQLDRLVDDPGWRTLSDVAGGELLECFFREREVFCRRRYRRKTGRT